VLSPVGHLPDVGEVLRDHRHPERVAGQEGDGADLAGSDADVELPDALADLALVERRIGLQV
jgi:hypothetical protein